MLRRYLPVLLLFFLSSQSYATGEPSTYFQIFVPPNNDAVRRDAALIITAIFDSTSFEIIDDGMDGDTDDSKTGMLMAGQSYVLFIRDNGINDDARYASGGVLKWDGDYFIVKSSKLVFASQSTNSDWQHDWVPSTDKKSIGKKYIIYSPPYSSSKRDINVYAYEPNTTVSFQKISTQPKTNTGFTDVNFENPVTIFTRTLNPGEDLIDKYREGRDVMEAGETYLVLADKPVTVQYGALFGNERDGGGYVPSSNGSSSGELFYFLVPFQSAGEQEIRIVSWSNANAIKLERYLNGSWVAVKSFVLDSLKAGDWVGKIDGGVSYSSCFRVSCKAGKRVSIFEGNWFETGSPGTSDMATMVCSDNGTTSGTSFLTYMAPPGSEQNVLDPFTGKVFGQQLTHLYVFSKKGASITIKDAYSNGTKYKKTFKIAPERYIDCALTLTEWKSIYNGTGTASGPERPYLQVESSDPVAVMNTNFNDNWMAYTGTSLEQSFTERSSVSKNAAIPGDTIQVTTIIDCQAAVSAPRIDIVVQDGLKVIQSVLKTPAENKTGAVAVNDGSTTVSFRNIGDFSAHSQFALETSLIATPGNNAGVLLSSPSNATIETILTGTVNGQLQQSNITEVVNINPSNTSKLIFSRYVDSLLNRDSTDSWSVSWIDLNQDGYDDIFTTDRRAGKPNLIYLNNKKGGFSRGQSLIQDSAISISNTWADINNDGWTDLLVLNNTRKPNTFYKNFNGVLQKDNSQAFTQTVGYYHGGAFADYDNDGLVDLFVCNYFPTRYNELYRNAGDGKFVKVVSNLIPSEASQSIGPSWADYDGDGFQDLFVPNGNGYKNSLFHNDGNGSFSKAKIIVNNEGGQSVGSCWGDYDNDGDLDLFVANSSGTGNFFYRNDGKAGFSKISTGVVATDRIAAHGCSFADIDNDGDLDLYITNDRSFRRLYINDGRGGFAINDNELIAMNFGNSFGHSWSDYDHDGDLDLLVATHSGQPNALFLNNGNNNHWIELNLKSTSSNGSAIGADVSIYSNGKWQLREVNAQSGLAGQGSFTQHFGIGTASVIDSVRVKWPGGATQVLTNVSGNQLLTITETKAVHISGAVFFDMNGNCKKDTGEVLVGHAMLQVANNESRYFTDNTGNFSIPVTAGNWTIGLVPDNKTDSKCSTQSIKVVDTDIHDLLIPAIPLCNAQDAGIIVGSTAIRKGYNNNQMTLIASNSGRGLVTDARVTVKLPVTINVLLPSLPIASTEYVTEQNKTMVIYSWKIPSIPAFGTQLINFYHSTSTGVEIGDTIPVAAGIFIQDADCDLSNNNVAQLYKVVGAIDPNDIQVSPAGYGAQGFIPTGQNLTYTVRFKNIGNQAATSISILDTLPDGLDLSTLTIIATSMPGCQYSYKNRVAHFEWNDVLLPDSVSDNEKSEGYISFSLSQQPALLPGTKLVNRASIRFDHFAGLITNEVINTIQSPYWEQSMIEVRAFPNPASDVLYFSLVNKADKEYTRREVRQFDMIDMNGRTLFSRQFHKGDEYRINIPVWLKGFYFIKLTDNQGVFYTRKIMIAKKS